MTIVNHECYVSLEVAKLLKEAGFDWELNSRWQDWGGKNSHEFILKTDLFYTDRPAEYDGFHALPAPTLDVAQRWLREVKHLDISIHYDPTIKSQPYVYVIYDIDEKFNDISGIISPVTHSDSYGYFYTYEDALEAGIKEALEIFLDE